VLRRISEQGLVIRSSAEEVHRALHVPSTRTEGLDQRAIDIFIR
jgi:hypothetical protein